MKPGRVLVLVFPTLISTVPSSITMWNPGKWSYKARKRKEQKTFQSLHCPVLHINLAAKVLYTAPQG